MEVTYTKEYIYRLWGSKVKRNVHYKVAGRIMKNRNCGVIYSDFAIEMEPKGRDHEGTHYLYIINHHEYL